MRGSRSQSSTEGAACASRLPSDDVPVAMYEALPYLNSLSSMLASICMSIPAQTLFGAFALG